MIITRYTAFGKTTSAIAPNHLVVSPASLAIAMPRSRRPLPSSISIPRLLFAAHVLLCTVSGVLSSRFVTLGSIKLFTTHEWIPTKPTIYFQCQGENMIILPDVKEKDFCTLFMVKNLGRFVVKEDLIMPLTELPEGKCRRCGIHGHDSFKSDVVFGEWELCPGNFVDGKYVYLKVKEFNATFICPHCSASDGVDGAGSGKRVAPVIVIVLCVSASAVVVAGLFALREYWKKRKREDEKARFLKLFEGDDIDDELGLGDVI